MNALETTTTALRSLARNGLRSFLTALGIIIGVAAVIAMVAIGEGAKSTVEDMFASMGTNLLILLPGSSTSGGARGGFGSQPTLTWDDLRAIQTEVPSVAYACPELRTTAQLLSEDQNWTTMVQGTTPDYLAVRSWSVASGTPMSTGDVDSGAKVVMLGKTTAEKLFGAGADPVGQVIRIRNVPFQVIGVLAAKGQSPMGQDYDDTALIPASTFQRRILPSFGNTIGGIILISARSGDVTERAMGEVSALLRDRHRIGPASEDDFSIRNLAEVASSAQQSTQTLSTLLASIAAVSLLVGGIGIMNIMLVSVTERTREIGVRMAVGATPVQVLSQFLAESFSLAFIGGLLGVAIGVVVASQLATQFQWPLKISPGVVLLSTSFSALVGIGFGLYPALKASRMDPITALRFE